MSEKGLKKLKNVVKSAVDLFLKNDKNLIDLKVYEPAVSHRIAVYLEEIFNDKFLNYDCEYDKYFDHAKKAINGKKIRPDILIHKRMLSDNNILAIEIKKNRRSQWDEDKLKDLTKQNGLFKYKLGVFIRFQNCAPEYKWFVDGVEKE